MEDEAQNPVENSRVGYCKPPKHTQFKKGMSGNPKGRPKIDPLRAAKELSFEQSFKEIFSVPIHATIDGKPQKVNGIQASLLQLKKQACSGNLAALRLMVNLYKLLGIGKDSDGNRQLEGLFQALKAGPVRTHKE